MEGGGLWDQQLPAVPGGLLAEGGMGAYQVGSGATRLSGTGSSAVNTEVASGLHASEITSDDIRAFAHGTSPESAIDISSIGVSEDKGKDLPRGGRYARHDSFHTFELGPPDAPGEGLQLAYEFGLRHSDPADVVIMQIPARIYTELFGGVS